MVAIGSSGVLAPGRLRWLRALGWLVALCVGAVVAYNAVSKATLWLGMRASGVATTSTLEAPLALKFISTCIGLVGLMALYSLAIRCAERRRVAEFAWPNLALETAVGLAIGTVLLGTIVAAQFLFGWVIIQPKAIDAVTVALRDSLRSAIFEELVLRLIIFRLLWRAFGIWPALLGAALVFGLLHLANPDSGLFAALCLSAGEGAAIALYLITGRIWASVGMHAGWNFTQGWLFGAAVSGTTGIAGGPFTTKPAPNISDLLSGGAFGPEASLAALFVSLIASGILLWGAWRNGAFVAIDQ